MIKVDLLFLHLLLAAGAVPVLMERLFQKLDDQLPQGERALLLSLKQIY